MQYEDEYILFKSLIAYEDIDYKYLFVTDKT